MKLHAVKRMGVFFGNSSLRFRRRRLFVPYPPSPIDSLLLLPPRGSV